MWLATGYHTGPESWSISMGLRPWRPHWGYNLFAKPEPFKVTSEKDKYNSHPASDHYCSSTILNTIPLWVIIVRKPGLCWNFHFLSFRWKTSCCITPQVPFLCVFVEHMGTLEWNIDSWIGLGFQEHCMNPGCLRNGQSKLWAYFKAYLHQHFVLLC